MRKAFSYINKALKMLLNIFLPVILPIFHYQCISFGQFTQYSNQASHIIIVITAFIFFVILNVLYLVAYFIMPKKQEEIEL